MAFNLKIYLLLVVFSLLLVGTDCSGKNNKKKKKKKKKNKDYEMLVSCAEKDIESPGWDIGEPVKDVANDATCQVLCQQNASCEFFEYNYKKQKCQLKFQLASNTLDIKNLVTGPKYCSGETGSMGLDCKSYGKCKECDAFDCVKCKDGFYYDPVLLKCQACSFIKNCKKDQCMHTGCEKCKSGYYKTNQKGVNICEQPSAFAEETAEVDVCESQIDWRGVNLAGAEFGVANPGEYNIDYIYPEDAEQPPNYRYFIAAGMNTFRIPFRWERIQHAPGWKLDTTELGRLKSQVLAIIDTHPSTKVLLDLHNYGRYCFWKLKNNCTTIVGEDKRIQAWHLTDVWKKIMDNFPKYKDRILIGLMNEPNNQDHQIWFDTAQRAIAKLREDGVQNYILVPGGNWTTAGNWMISPNKDIMHQYSDPLNRTFIDIHTYFDEDESGTTDSCADEEIGYWRLRGVTEWLKLHGLRGVLSEFGSSNSLKCLNTVHRALSYMENNKEQWKGWVWWAAGPWWGDYMFSIEPDLLGSKHKDQMLVLMAHMCPPETRSFEYESKSVDENDFFDVDQTRM